MILNVLETRGKVRFDDLALELNIPKGEVKNLVQDIIGKKLFQGYVNWKKEILFSIEFSGVHSCPNCGAPMTVAGKGSVYCEYCSTEIFLR